MPQRLQGRASSSSLLLLFLLLGAVVTATEAVAVVPMEVYFSPAELVRIAGYGEEPVSTVVVSGQVVCELSLGPPGSDLLTFELPGAAVGVACETEGTKTMAYSVFAITDENGNFTIELPSRLHATPNLEKACSVMVLQLPLETVCRLRHGPSSSHGIRLSSSEDGVRTYMTGVIRLQHHDTKSDIFVHIVGTEQN
ncbi:hypothetical protein E2562_019588 [Oryza meyeriana var. granulata]|uniref:Uncharacterized protein n=1 Tax=Oryza meyeriana var. granulata TaxID=110450 RepID=A0A6G1EXA5_9ORYZ|nr:hypothetical protein E2562_019588 [Oryza meyeriana var. granulata]